LKARRILVATGVRDELPDIPGVRERWGRYPLHCPYCHAWEVRDQPVGVLGALPGSAQHALLVEAGKQFRRVNGHLHLKSLRDTLERVTGTVIPTRHTGTVNAA